MRRSIIILLLLLILGIALGAVSCSDHKKASESNVYIVYQADLSRVTDKQQSMKDIIHVIEKRTMAYGVAKPVVHQIGDDRIEVQLPLIPDIEQAKHLIGEKALIKFKTFVSSEHGNFALRQDAEGNTGLIPVDEGTGNYVAVPAKAEVNGIIKELTSEFVVAGEADFGFAGEDRMPGVYFKWDDEGADIFEQITTRLSAQPASSVERRLGMFVGDTYVYAPYVQMPIRGMCVIHGLSEKDSRRLAELLNAGHIPVPLSIIELKKTPNNSINPTARGAHKLGLVCNQRLFPIHLAAYTGVVFNSVVCYDSIKEIGRQGRVAISPLQPVISSVICQKG